MNYTEHASGAKLAAVSIGSIAVLSGQTPVDSGALLEFARHPLQDGPVRTLLMAMAFAWLMALFPDVDTESRPRKIFHRVAFAAVFGLWYFRMYDLMGLVALAAIAPLLHRHRGWTHHWLTPWILAILLAVAWEYARVQDGWFRSFSWENVFGFLAERWIFPVSIVAGHYIHLLLDHPLIGKVYRRPG